MIFSLRTLYGFGQSAPAITLALRRAFQEGMLDQQRLNFTYASFYGYKFRTIFTVLSGT
jgi:hypothetical protein